MLTKRSLPMVSVLASVLALTAGQNSPPLQAQSSAGVQVVDADRLVQVGLHPFDLEGRTLRFHPVDDGYTVDNVALAFDGLPGATVTPGESIPLPFAFQFAGQAFDHVYPNLNGNLSFGRSENAVWPERDPWADGTMRAVAAALDARSAAGVERVIAVLWAIYGQGTVETAFRGGAFIVTWRVMRPEPVWRYYEPLGPNVFQVRLYPSGDLEFSYQRVSEADGVVGVFRGLSGPRAVLDTVSEPGDAHPSVDMVRFDVVDTGSTLAGVFEMAEDVPASISSGTSLFYRWFLEIGGRRCSVELGVTSTGHRPPTSTCGAGPRVSGALVRGRRVELYLSRTALQERDSFSWGTDVVWFGIPGRFDQVHLSSPRPVSVDGAAIDLSDERGPFNGNVFEVFHYPSLTKSIDAVMSGIYGRLPAIDDIAVPLTDFRTDDLYNHGPSSGPLNVSIQGIGPAYSAAPSGTAYGSSTLQVAISPLFVGGPRLSATPRAGIRNHGFAVWWVVHETVHRWAAGLRFRNPLSGAVEPLTGGGCGCHWSEWLHLPAVNPVWAQFSDTPYPEASPMGGGLLEEQPDGTFIRRPVPSNDAATGLSALDLYVMGLIGPDDVPEMFVLQNPVRLANGRYAGTKVPVRIADIVGVQGPRVPSSSAAQREFRLAVYLLHESGRAVRPDMLARAQAIRANLVQYFSTATGGRIRIVGGSPMAPALAATETSRNPVTLTWSAVPGATSYVLHAGTQPGASDLGVFQMGLATSITASAPVGLRLFVRIVVSAEEGTSTSNEVDFILGPPGPPVLSVVQALVNPVSLAWSAGPGGAPAAYSLHAGTAAGTSNLGVFPMGMANNIVASAPAGLPVHVRVIAANGFGSAVSNEVSFAVGRGTLSPPVLHAATVVGATVNLSWTPAAGSTPQAYQLRARLSASGPIIASLGSMATSLAVPGVPPGSYFVSVVAIADGLTSGESNQIVVSVP